MMNDKDIALAVAEAVEAAAAATAAVSTPRFRKLMLPVDVDSEVESAVDLLKEMYNEVVAAVILKSPPTLAPTVVAASRPRILIDSFYVLNAKGYKFVEQEHPPEVESKRSLEVAAAPSKVEATINLKILINDKNLTTIIAEEATTTPKALKAQPNKLKILMNGKDIALAMAEAAEAAAATTAAVQTTSFRKSMLLVESAIDLLKEMYNDVVAAAILKSPACDAVAFIKSPVTPAAAIDFFVLCTFTASSSDSAAFVPPSTPLPSQPTLTPTAMAASPPRILIDSFYAELNANGYKFAELEHPPEAKPEHPPKVAAAPSKAGAAINLKILIKGKDLNTAIAKDVTATLNAPKAPKALKAALMKLKILMNDKDIALAMTEVVEAAAAATATVPTSRLRKPLFPVNVDLEVESFTDLLKEMYNEVVASAILKSSELMLLVEEACDAVAFIESPAAPAAAIDIFVLCTFMAFPSDYAAYVLPPLRSLLSLLVLRSILNLLVLCSLR
ncbi:unnamed protein product [Prunus armeniaca]|uniref:Uncharacterized protein n=1 Tax=Prunus armeniaca TaxID=36596 RepID=A0A6J5W5M5_PRUAR|nr:unnamed protein product [Prunus armeniaca]